jgi:hypothetical protein
LLEKATASADPFTGAKLVWKQDHLLQIQYDVAHIEQFRNLWGLWEVENAGSTGERNFEVEIRCRTIGWGLLCTDA